MYSRAANVWDYQGGSGADCDGHGTDVAGIIGGMTYGVAKSVTLRGLRVVDCEGYGQASSALAAIDWVYAHHAPVKPAVVNMSLRCYDPASKALDDGVRKLIAGDATHRSIVVAVAAGNEHENACHYTAGDDQGVSPARVMEAYTVAAFTKSDSAPAFTNYAASGAQACVDSYAPVYGIKSTYLGDSTAFLSGTSMASPHVAGAAALLAQRFHERRGDRDHARLGRDERRDHLQSRRHAQPAAV